MSNTEYNKGKVIRYLIWTFALAYLVQLGVGKLYANGNAAAGIPLAVATPKSTGCWVLRQ